VSATATASHETGATRACAVHGRLRALVIPARRPRCTSLARPLMGARRLTHAPSSFRQQRMHTAAMIACHVLRVSQVAASSMPIRRPVGPRRNGSLPVLPRHGPERGLEHQRRRCRTPRTMPAVVSARTRMPGTHGTQLRLAVVPRDVRQPGTPWRLVVPNAISPKEGPGATLR